MGVPLRQSYRSRHLCGCARSSAAGQALSADRGAGAAVPVQPGVRAAARSSTPTRSCAGGCRSSRRSAAIEECGAPMVSIAGGEPLIHPRDPRDRRASWSSAGSSCYLCTNALLLREEAGQVQAVARTSPGRCTSTGCASGTTSRSAEGVFDKAVAAIKAAKAAGFRVTTNTTFFNTDSPTDGASRCSTSSTTTSRSTR